MGYNGWTHNIESLLRNWSQQISINEVEYRKRGTYYRYWYHGFGAFIIITQTGAVTTLLNVVIAILGTGPNISVNNAQAALLITIVCAEIMILIIQGLDKFFNFGSGSELYYQAAKDHNSLSKLIDTTLTLPRKDRDLAREILKSIREQFRKLQQDSPNLPSNDRIHKLDMCIYNDPKQAKGMRKADSPPIENIAVDLPNIDNEPINKAQQCRLEQQFEQQKRSSIPDLHRPWNNLEYQWRRLAQHDEDEYNEDTD